MIEDENKAPLMVMVGVSAMLLAAAMFWACLEAYTVSACLDLGHEPDTCADLVR